MPRSLALDCEMIEGPRKQSMVAEVGIVDWNGDTVYHSYVQPTAEVKDYRTAISGITAEKLVDAPTFAEVQRDVLRILNGNTLVGHALENDLKALGLRFRGDLRNTAHHPAFQSMGPRGQMQPRKLAALHEQYVGNVIQQGEHGAVEDARASMRVYRTYHEKWEEPVRHEGPLWDPAMPLPLPFSKRRTNSPALPGSSM